MHVVGKLLRAKIGAEHRGQSVVASSRGPPAWTRHCWLCGLDATNHFQLVDQLPLCHSCFQIAYTAVVLPALRRLSIGADLARVVAEYVAAEAKKEEAAAAPVQPNSEPAARMMHVQSYASLRNAGKTGGEPWACARCTLINAADDDACAACGTASPRAITCTHCGERCAAAGTNRLGVCAAAQGRQHEVWECDRCTVVNTVVADSCFICASPRLWTCDVCQFSGNRSSAGRVSEMFCAACGSAPLTASMRRIFLAEQEKERALVDKHERERDRLFRRLAAIGVERRFQLSDGNCQFRALSQQLLGSSKHHMLVRHVIVEHIARNSAHYGQFFESEHELKGYIARMRQSATWGDELTLKACSEIFGVHVHVISSEVRHWHIHFRPCSDSTATGGAAGAANKKLEGADVAHWPEDGDEPAASRGGGVSDGDSAPHIFVAYLHGAHYDDILRPPPLPSIGEELSAALHRIRADEDEWDDAASEESSGAPAAAPQPPAAAAAAAAAAAPTNEAGSAAAVDSSKVVIIGESSTSTLFCRPSSGIGGASGCADWIEIHHEKKSHRV